MLYTIQRGSMGTCRQLSALLLTATIVSACASAKRSQGIRPELLGTYRFDEQLSPDDRLQGTFVVGEDSVAIDAYPGPCRYERDRSNLLYITYTCGGVAYSFDRTDPVRKATYSAIVHLKETRQVCVRYTTNTTGRQVCAQMANETYYRDARRSGLLRVERVEDVQWRLVVLSGAKHLIVECVRN
jgi:hypothetical protein